MKSQKEIFKFAREGNLVRFERAVKSLLAEKIPAVIHNERVKLANLMFNQRPKT